MIILTYIATLGFIGYIPFAPGTFGTLFALILFFIIKPSIFTHIIILVVIIPVAIFSSHYAEIYLNKKDCRNIVIDEFCGYFLSMLFIPHNTAYIITAFFLFRFFDILKPFPIRKIESTLSGGKGIVADDIAAALYTNIILQICKLIKI
ncbi:MAG: phosphatidylglycerophosphatase A [Nitrospirota bacterium]